MFDEVVALLEPGEEVSLRTALPNLRDKGTARAQDFLGKCFRSLAQRDDA